MKAIEELIKNKKMKVTLSGHGKAIQRGGVEHMIISFADNSGNCIGAIQAEEKNILKEAETFLTKIKKSKK